MSSPLNAGRGNVTPAALQGHFSLKSSPFNAVSGKLTTQSLVVDHMNAHYRKLVKAKPAIDTGVPVSYLRSQKVRDRQRRDALMRGDAPPSSSSSTPRRSSRPMSARSQGDSRSGSAVPAPDDDYFLEGRAAHPGDHERYPDADTRLAYEQYARALATGSSSQPGGMAATGNQTMVSQYGGGGGDAAASWWQPPQSARSAGAVSAASSGGDTTKSVSRGQQLALAKDTLLRRGMSADILDKRHHKFTDPIKSFTPRTLKKDVQSRLSSYKYYNRPQPSSTDPVPSLAGGNSPGRTDGDDIVHDSADSVILDETLVSRDFERGSSIDHSTVPPLEMSLDTDHMKWLKEQSAERRLRSKPRPDERSAARAEHEAHSHGPVAAAGLTSSAPRAAPRRYVTAGSARQQISREDEELMYLNFVTQVTNDILTRGIFSDRVLQQVFEEHVARERDNLDESRMRALLDTLRDDLGITTPPPPISLKTGADVGTSRSVAIAEQRMLAEPHTSQWEPATVSAGSAFTRPKAGKGDASSIAGQAAADPRLLAVSKAAAAATANSRRPTAAEGRGDGRDVTAVSLAVRGTASEPARYDSPAEGRPTSLDDEDLSSERAATNSREEPDRGADDDDSDRRTDDGDDPSPPHGADALPGTTAIARVLTRDDDDDASDVELRQAHERSVAGDSMPRSLAKAASGKSESDNGTVSEGDFEEYKSDEYDSIDESLSTP